MSLRISLVALASLFCLNSARVIAQIRPFSPTRTFNFSLPEKVRTSKPQFSLKEIQQRAKKGQLKSPPRLGGMDGGGGKVLLCLEKDGIRTKVLDIHEGENTGLRMDLGNGKTLDEKIKYVLNRLEKVAPVHARAYAQWIHDLLENESAFFENAMMPVTEDIGLTVTPANCEIVQVVVQRNSEEAEIPGVSRYLFDKDVFIQLDLDSQVALIFHEVVYREARMRGEKDSFKSRYLTSLILSSKMESMTVDEFNQILMKLKSKCLEIPGITGRYECGDLPPVFSQQSITWRGLPFEGNISLNFGKSDKILFVKSQDAVFDLTKIAKTLNPNFTFDLRISILPNHELELYVFEENRVETSDLVAVEARSHRATMSGKCLVKLNRHITQWENSEHYLYCTEAQILQDNVTQQFTNTHYVLFRKDGSIDVRKK